uniref:Uncharacterized protein n=1 Tax=Candidatus Methanomethylicus mesodigestus TaxID=1867258 RepID=A0A7C3ERS2_9CREN
MDDRKTVLEDVEGIYRRIKAPKRKFRLVMIDTWDAPYCSDEDMGVFDTLEGAIRRGIREERREVGDGDQDWLKFYIYDDEGRWLGEIRGGKFSTEK